MNNNELLNLIDNIPYEILTYANSKYTVQEIAFPPKRVEINFVLNNAIVCFIKVYGDNTIFLSYFNAALAYFNDEEEKPEYKNCYIAMEQTKAYLEILGFQCVN